MRALVKYVAVIPALAALAALPACHGSDDEELEFPVITSGLTESSDPSTIDTASASVSAQGVIAAGNRFAPYLFEVKGTANIVVTLGLPRSQMRGGIALYGPRGPSGRFGLAVARAIGRGRVALSASLSTAGVYLLVIGRNPQREAAAFTLAAACDGAGCGPARPYCATPACVFECPSGFREDASGCPTCACNDTFTCAKDLDCRAGERCSSGACTSCGCESQPLDLVCDANGRRYKNACELACRGGTAAACPTRACTTDSNCPAGLVCTGGQCDVDATCLTACAADGEAVCGVVGTRIETFRNRCVLSCLRGEILAPQACRRGCETDVSCPTVSCRFGQRRNAKGCLTCECRTAPACTTDSMCGPGAACESGTCVTSAGCATLSAAPFCGADGREYRNDCERRCRVGGTATAGACSSSTSCSIACTANSDCLSASVGGTGVALACVAGVCSNTTCNLASGPVCGTDGVTYASTCAIPWCRGVRVRASGACIAFTDTCAMGAQLVCGNDGRTHACADKAIADGTTVRHGGPCVCSPACVSDAQCAGLNTSTIQYQCSSNRCRPKDCDSSRSVVGSDGRTYESACAVPWCRGITVSAPRMVCSDVLRPVCARRLIAETYRNACEALTAGAAILHPGVCNPSAVCTYSTAYDPYCTDFGTVENPSVAACLSSVCVDSACLSLGLRTRGVCNATRCGCPTTLSPVCGTDGRTYSNACVARCSSALVASSGFCTATATP